MANYEILPGLLPYGPPAEAFSPTGMGTHSEGFVVRFTDPDGRTWVGNFRPGLTDLTGAFQHPNGHDCLVVSSGRGYWVKPADPKFRQYFGGMIEVVLPLPELNAVLFGDPIRFECIGITGILWRSRRVSWDGMRNINKDGLTLTGESCDLGGAWLQFSLDLSSVQTIGGGYNGPE